MNKVSVRDLNVKGKRVLVRVDLNVTIDKNGEIIEENKIRSSLPTIQYLAEQGALVIIVSHLGRPNGQVVEELRMDPVAKKLADMLGKPVYKTDKVVGEEPLKALEMLKDGDILMLENIRFHPGETANDPKLAEEFAALADFYVNDAFGTCHRSHASTVGVAKLLPSAAGLNMEKEINIMSSIMDDPERPLVAILGGTKVADKIGLIAHFIDVVDILLIGGGMANTFLKAKGYEMGRSFVEQDKVEAAKEILNTVEGKKAKFVLPVDFVAASEASEDSDQKVVAAAHVPSDWMALDIGPETVNQFQKYLKTAKTVIWNGPLGMFEIEDFAQGTVKTAQFIADLEAVKVIGGGDVVAAVERAEVAHKMTHISTGGGAALEFWEGKELPALSVLPEKVTV